MWYNIDIRKLVTLLTPTFLRGRRHLAWLRALHLPLVQLLNHFQRTRQMQLFDLHHNGQVHLLTHALNSRFDLSLKRIRIVDGNMYKRKYIYTTVEQLPLFMGICYLHNNVHYADAKVDFIVVLPAGLIYNRHEMIAMVEQYKLASMRYTIEQN